MPSSHEHESFALVSLCRRKRRSAGCKNPTVARMAPSATIWSVPRVHDRSMNWHQTSSPLDDSNWYCAQVQVSQFGGHG